MKKKTFYNPKDGTYTCTRGHIDNKPYKTFTIAPSGKRYHGYRCGICYRLYWYPKKKKWRENNREYDRKANKASYEKHKESHRKRNKLWCIKNKSKLKEYTKKHYYKNHKRTIEMRRIRDAKRVYGVFFEVILKLRDYERRLRIRSGPKRLYE